MKILFIAYHFPPLGGSGVQRLLKFAKFLPVYDIEPMILTVRYKLVRTPKDFSLLKQIPKQTRTYRTFTVDLNWLFKLLWGLRLPQIVTWIQNHWLIPDKEITWLPFARKKAGELAERQPFELTFVSGGPFSAFAIAYELKKHLGIPYILDFRDEWIHNPTRLIQNYTRERNRREEALELKMVSQADGIVYLSEVMKENFIRRYAFLNSKPSRVIPNGYDEEDFAVLQPKAKRQSVFQIVFTGSFYDRTRPTIILRALLDLTHSGAIAKDKISFDVYGKNTRSFFIQEMDESSSELDFLHLHPYVSHGQSLQIQMDAELLLIYIQPGLNAESGYSGKLFEYIRTGRPILAVCPPKGLAADLVRETRTGWIADSADVQAIKDGFLECYQKWEKGELAIEPDWQVVQHYERRNQAGQLADLMNEVLDRKE